MHFNKSYYRKVHCRDVTIKTTTRHGPHGNQYATERKTVRTNSKLHFKIWESNDDPLKEGYDMIFY